MDCICYLLLPRCLNACYMDLYRFQVPCRPSFIYWFIGAWGGEHKQEICYIALKWFEVPCRLSYIYIYTLICRDLYWFRSIDLRANWELCWCVSLCFTTSCSVRGAPILELTCVLYWLDWFAVFICVFCSFIMILNRLPTQFFLYVYMLIGIGSYRSISIDGVLTWNCVDLMVMFY